MSALGWTLSMTGGGRGMGDSLTGQGGYMWAG